MSGAVAAARPSFTNEMFENRSRVNRNMSFETIEAKMREFIFVGAKRQDVENYLTWSNVNHDYWKTNPNENKVLLGAIFRIRGSWFLDRRDLRFFVYFDKADVVEKVEFLVEGTAVI